MMGFILAAACQGQEVPPVPLLLIRAQQHRRHYGACQEQPEPHLGPTEPESALLKLPWQMRRQVKG